MGIESFHWDANFETGLVDIDEQHHRLVDLINHFGDILGSAAGQDVATIREVINDLVAYSQYHFKHEEGLMKDVGLDGQYVEKHIKLHAEFCQFVNEMLLGQSLENTLITSKLLKFLIHWLANHILGTDQFMAKQISAIKAGASPQDAYEQSLDTADGAMETMLRALNGLFREVSERNRELLELNRTLEAKVEERTRNLEIANKKLQEMALTDTLTGLPNRRHAMVVLNAVWLESVATGQPLSVMMIDADGFKQINDTCGHDAGDRVLAELSRCLKHAVRSDDLVCRLGGDEFLIICPATPLKGALLVAENLRKAVESIRVEAKNGYWQGSVSVGVAASSEDMTGHEALIKAADVAVYESKRNGRNRVSW